MFNNRMYNSVPVGGTNFYPPLDHQYVYFNHENAVVTKGQLSA